MKCNHCGHVVYGETRVCPMCGGEMSPDIPPGTPKCPRCDCELEIHSYRDCGCWLDAGELKQIRSFIAAGGLEEAQDKQLAGHASQLRSLDTRVSDVEFMQKLLHKWEGKRWVFQGF